MKTMAQLRAHDYVAQLAAEFREKENAAVRALGFRRVAQDQTVRGEWRRGKYGKEWHPIEERPIWAEDLTSQE